MDRNQWSGIICFEHDHRPQYARISRLARCRSRPSSAPDAFLSKIEEEVETGGRKYLLAVNKYPGTIYPQGHLHLEQFRFDRYPVFVYRVGGAVIEKSVFMPYGDNTTLVTYKVLDSESPGKDHTHPHNQPQRCSRENPRRSAVELYPIHESKGSGN